MPTTHDNIIAEIESYRAKKIRSFALLIKLEGEAGKSKAQLQAAIDETKNNIFPQMGVVLDSEKFHWRYDEKTKSTYFQTFLYCKFKENLP